MGRQRREDLRQHYIPASDEQSKGMKSQAVACKYCGKVLAGTTTRMECHLKACNSFKELRKGNPELEAGFKEVLSSKAWKNSAGRRGGRGLGTNKRGKNGRGPNKRLKPANEKVDQERCANLFAKALMANMLPVDIFYTPDWQDFMKAAAPSFRLPSKEVLTTKYLFGLQQKLNTDVITAIVDCTALGFVFNKFIFNETTQQHSCNRMVCTPYPFYWGSYRFATIDSQSVKKAFAELVDELSVSFKIANRQVPRIWGMCLSHAELGSVTHALNQDNELPKGLLPYGCGIVGLQKFGALFMKTPAVAAVMEKAMTVSSDVLGNVDLQEAFKQSQEKVFKGHLKLPKTADADWCSNYFLLLAMKMNQPVFQELLENLPEGVALSKESWAVLKDGTFWSAVSCVVAIFKPLKDVLDILGCDGNPISFVTASYVYVKAVVHTILSEEGEELKALLGTKTAQDFGATFDKLLDESWNEIQGIPLTLSFCLDPLFCAWRKTLEDNKFTLGGASIVQSATGAFETLLKAEIYPPSDAMAEFSLWIGNSHARTFLVSSIHPKSFWGLEAGANPSLSGLGFDLFSFPACDISADPKVISLYGNAMAKSSAPNSNARAGIPYNSQKLQIREKLVKKPRDLEIIKFFTEEQFIRPSELRPQFIMENLDVIYDVEIDDLNGDNMSDFKGIPRMASPLNSRGIPAVVLPPPKAPAVEEPRHPIPNHLQQPNHGHAGHVEGGLPLAPPGPHPSDVPNHQVGHQVPGVLQGTNAQPQVILAHQLQQHSSAMDANNIVGMQHQV